MDNSLEVEKELREFIKNSIIARVENDLQVIKDQLIKKSKIYLNLLNKENRTSFNYNVEKLVNEELYKEVLK